MYRLLTVFCLLTAAASAAVKLPAVIGDNMVLQRDRANTVWGWADAGEKISIECAGQKVETEASKSGRWSVRLKPLAVSKEPIPFKITDSAGSRELQNVKVGEVWLCSGQSNMQWSIDRSENGKDVASRADHPDIHLFQIPLVSKRSLQDDVKANWRVCKPDNAGGFSAVAYYFGVSIQKELDVPIGLIQSAWGGSRIEPWIPREAFAWFAELGPIFNQINEATPGTAWHHIAQEKWVTDIREWTTKAEAALEKREKLPPMPKGPQPLKEDNRSPTVLYNAMIHPLVPYGIRGAIWYQGESNSGEGMSYFHKKKALVHGWRKVFENPDLGFHFVQLAPFKYGRDNGILAEFWEVQTACLGFPKTGMAVINDIATINDIHPPNKKDVGHRLALNALAQQYGKDIVYSGPLYKSHKIEGDKIRVEFDHVGGGLRARDDKDLSHFEIAGDDGKFVAAAAEIDGSGVVVSCPDVKLPANVRFAWSQLAEPNLMNAEGLPASSFRTNPVEP